MGYNFNTRHLNGTSKIMADKWINEAKQNSKQIVESDIEVSEKNVEDVQESVERLKKIKE